MDDSLLLGLRESCSNAERQLVGVCVCVCVWGGGGKGGVGVCFGGLGGGGGGKSVCMCVGGSDSIQPVVLVINS